MWHLRVNINQYEYELFFLAISTIVNKSLKPLMNMLSHSHPSPDHRNASFYKKNDVNVDKRPSNYATYLLKIVS